MSYSFKVENLGASIEILNLKLCENDDCHVTFDVCFTDANNSHKVNFSEMVFFRLKTDNFIFDENNFNKQLHFEKDKICLKILPDSDRYSEFELTCSINLEKHIVQEFLIEFEAYIDLLMEEKNNKIV